MRIGQPDAVPVVKKNLTAVTASGWETQRIAQPDTVTTVKFFKGIIRPNYRQIMPNYPLNRPFYGLSLYLYIISIINQVNVCLILISHNFFLVGKGGCIYYVEAS